MSDLRPLMVNEEDLALLYEGARLLAQRCRAALEDGDPLHRKAEEDVLARVVDLGAMLRTYMEAAKPLTYECLRCGGHDGGHAGTCTETVGGPLGAPALSSFLGSG